MRLKVTGLRLKRGGLAILDGVNFRLKHCAITALVGPNGSGKSTLINVISGFQRPDEGSVTYGGEELVGMDPAAVVRRGVARTFQERRLFEDLTVLEHLALAGQKSGPESVWQSLLRGPREIEAAQGRAQRVVREGGLADLENHAARSLSRGQGKLLENNKALALEPTLLLMDEPFAGLYSDKKALVADILRRLTKAGTTILFVEHDREAVRQLADEVIRLDKGRVVGTGLPEDRVSGGLREKQPE